MEILFSANLPADRTVPAGQILIRPLGADADRRNLSEIIVQRGIGALAAGAGPIRRIVIPCDTTRPTFDDMLATEFVQRLMEGQALPAGAAAFARYAAMVREGFQPGDAPLESSIEGIFLAIRKDAGDDLARSSNSAKFLADWQGMAQVVLQAAEQGRNPFTENLFPESAAFSRQRVFLKLDQDVYHEDINRGQRFMVQLPGNAGEKPGAGAESGAMLLLDQPRSMLWKYWSRRDPAAPGGKGYLLLVVRRGGGLWTISTDPVRRLNLKELAQRLQEAETQITFSPTRGDPWFDGAPFKHTLIAAPRGGSKLSEVVVLSIVKKWAGAHASPTLM